MSRRNIRRRSRLVVNPSYRKRLNQSSTARAYKRFGNLKLDRIKQQQNVNPSQSIVVDSMGMPDILYVDLVWAGIVNMQTSTAQISAIYEGNNPWDPDPQLGGTSARDYQILQQLYRYCRVYGSEINVSATIVNGNPFQIGVVPLNKNVGVPYDLMMTLPQFKRTKFFQTGGWTSDKVINYCNTGTLFGIDNLDFDLDHNFDLDNGESGTSVTEPPRRWYWYIYASSPSGQSGINCSVDIQIRYKCKFYSKKYLSGLSTVSSDGDVTATVMTDSNVKQITLT